MVSVSWVLILIQAVVSGAGVLLLRFSASRFTGFAGVTNQVLFTGLTGLFAYAASFLLWVYILSKTQASYAFPVTIGISLLVTTLGAWLAFGEKLTGGQIVGIILLIVAITVISIFGKPNS